MDTNGVTQSRHWNDSTIILQTPFGMWLHVAIKCYKHHDLCPATNNTKGPAYGSHGPLTDKVTISGSAGENVTLCTLVFQCSTWQTWLPDDLEVFKQMQQIADWNPATNDFDMIKWSKFWEDISIAHFWVDNDINEYKNVPNLLLKMKWRFWRFLVSPVQSIQ